MQTATRTIDQSVNLTRCQSLLGSRTSSQNLELGEKLGYKEDHDPEVYQFAFSTNTLNIAYDKPFDDGDGYAGNGTVIAWWEKSICGTLLVKTGISVDKILDWVWEISKLIDDKQDGFKNLGGNSSKFKKDFDPNTVIEIFENSRKISGFSDRIAKKYAFSPDYLTIGLSYQFVFSSHTSQLVLGMVDKGTEFNVWVDYIPDMRDTYSRPFHYAKKLDANQGFRRDHRSQNRRPRTNRRTSQGSNFIDTVSNPVPFFQCITSVGRKVRENYSHIYQFVTNSSD